MKQSSKINLADKDSACPRSTKNLLASLHSRLTILRYISGGEALGSIIAGMAKLGKEVSQTTEGLRLRNALESKHHTSNGRALWQKLRISDWLGNTIPSPVLDQLQNDVALVLSNDLHSELQAFTVYDRPTTCLTDDMGKIEIDYLDVTIGLWAYSRYFIRIIEDLASTSIETNTFKMDTIKKILI